MRPTDGQGGNQAFEDAVVLTRLLKASNSTSIPDALREFEQARVPRVKRIHDDQRIRYEKRMKGEVIGRPSEKWTEWLLQGV
jgi:2-polyprenyl-6-methoxyphenol hydroxylase-like FAD-dependent oxidoreductase